MSQANASQQLTNRENLIRLIKELAEIKVIKELNESMKIYSGSSTKYDLADAFDDYYQQCENANRRKMMKELRAILIAARAYVKSAGNTILGNYTFTQNGEEYEWPHSGGWNTWLDSNAKF